MPMQPEPLARDCHAGIGDQAAWLGFAEFGSDTLAVGKGDFYFQLRMRLPELDSATQLDRFLRAFRLLHEGSWPITSRDDR